MVQAFAQRAFEHLDSGKLTLAVAESCTGGLASAEITSIPGASRVFRGAVVAYANVARMNLLKVPRELLEKKGPVCPEVAIAMAVGVRRRFASDVGVAVTGLAGPAFGDSTLPIGTVWFAFVDDHRQEALSEHFEGGRASIRSSATHCLFRYLALFLSGT